MSVRRSRRRTATYKRLGVAVATAVVAVPLHAVAADAAVVAPDLDRNVVVFPVRDFMSIEGAGWNALNGQTLTINVYRDGVLIGVASGTAGLGDPALEVNHPGGVCWTGTTPDLLPGDIVEVLEPNGVDGVSMRTAGVSATAAVREDYNGDGVDDVVVRGRAVGPDGLPISLEFLEQRIVNPDLVETEVGKRDIRAPGRGSMSYDPVGAGNEDGTRFTARFLGASQTEPGGLSPAAVSAALAGQTRVLHWAVDPVTLERVGITIYEADEVGGPGMPECPAAAVDAVNASTPKNITVATQGSNLLLSGTSYNASSVSVTVKDSAQNSTAVVTVTPNRPASTNAYVQPTLPGSQTWSATVPVASLGGLGQGELVASGTYQRVTQHPTNTVPAVDANGNPVLTDPSDPNSAPVMVPERTEAPINGAEHVLIKDTVAPGTPTASLPGGTYFGSQSVQLDPVDEANDTVRYRIGADAATVPAPTSSSPIASGPILITSTQTIKAISFDPVGNPSPMLTATYTIRQLSAPSQPAAPTAVAGNAQATVSWTPPASDGGSAVTNYRIRGFTTSTTPVVDVTVGNQLSLVVTGLTNGTSYTFSVAAINGIGESVQSARSNSVIPRATTTVPGAPTIGTASRGNASAVVRWTAPASNGGSAITGYSIRTYLGTSTTLVKTTSAGGSATSVTVTGLTNGTSYSFDVRAINAVGTGAASARSNVVTPATVPTAPIIGTAASGVAGGTITATANWSPPTSTGGSPITGYRVFALRMSSTGTVLSTTQSAVLASTARTLQMTLTSGNYRFQVVAINAVGTSPRSARSNLVTAR